MTERRKPAPRPSPKPDRPEEPRWDGEAGRTPPTDVDKDDELAALAAYLWAERGRRRRMARSD